MNYLRGAISAASQYYKDLPPINPSTLTGAIDVIVIRRRTSDGSEELACSPFHVRFGKWQVLRPADKKVEVTINGVPIPFSMKVGDAGEAFFVFETDDDDVPADLITSPILEAVKDGLANGNAQRGRVGPVEEGAGGVDDGLDSEDILGEPDAFDLDSTAPDGPTTPRPPSLPLSELDNPTVPQTPPGPPESPLQVSQGVSQEGHKAETSTGSNVSPLQFGVELGSAVVQAVVEHSRDTQGQFHDRIKAAQNIIANTRDTPSDESATEKQKGDEALPTIGQSEGDVPKVVYSHDMVYDMAGYHSKEKSTSGHLDRKRSREDTSGSDSDEPNESPSTDGRTTPRSWNASEEVTPELTPEGSRSPSPERRIGKHPYRAASEPPFIHYPSLESHDPYEHHQSGTGAPSSLASAAGDVEVTSASSPDMSQPAYSWEWGAFPQPSPMRGTFNLPGSSKSAVVAEPESADLSRLSVSRAHLDVHRSSSEPVSPYSGDSSPTGSVSDTTLSAILFDDLVTLAKGTILSEGKDLTADEYNSRRFLVRLPSPHQESMRQQRSHLQEFALSIVHGGFVDSRVTPDNASDSTLHDRNGDAKTNLSRFRSGQVSFRRFMKFPAAARDPELVIRWGERYISRQGVRNVKDNEVDTNLSEEDLGQIIETICDSLAQWREDAVAKRAREGIAIDEDEEPLSSSDEFEAEPKSDTEGSKTPERGVEAKSSSSVKRTTVQPVPKKTSSWVRWWRYGRSATPPAQQGAGAGSGSTGDVDADGDVGSMSARDAAAAATAASSGTDDMPTNGTRLAPPPRPHLVASSSTPIEVESGRTIGISRVASEPIPGSVSASSVSTITPTPRKRYAKTLRLTSDQLKQLELKDGPNPITFSLSASGVIACAARIFLWDESAHVVVSDIDGTITKSDALGHVFTMIGRDWTHLGVAKLYTDICRNGYQIMYLTSRAIGQADSTRDYLKGINQGNYQLPEGPVIMSPDRLMASLHREVIMRKPEVFKMACLRDIQRLFGEGKSPFYAGFGNRITDALSYRSVNIPSERIFTIDSTGEVKMELLDLAGYKSSYIHMTDLVDQMFPPIHRKWAAEFTDFNFWKTPLQEFTLPDLSVSPPSPALSARSDQSTFSRIRNFSLGRQSGRQFQLPPPVVQSGQQAKSGYATSDDEQEKSLRQMSSLERLRGFVMMRSTDSLHASSSSTLADSDYDRGRNQTAGRKLSMDSTQGSLSGSALSQDGLEEADEADGVDYDEEMEYGEDQYGDEEAGDAGEGYDEGIDETEAAEENFDDDLLAAGEMANVPFL